MMCVGAGLEPELREIRDDLETDVYDTCAEIDSE
jgi:hypothetical protein